MLKNQKTIYIKRYQKAPDAKYYSGLSDGCIFYSRDEKSWMHTDFKTINEAKAFFELKGYTVKQK